MLVYTEGPYKGQQVERTASVWSGGPDPQGNHYGNSYEFQDYATGPDGEVSPEGLGWRVDETLPLTGKEGEEYSIRYYGVSGSYTRTYVWESESGWVCIADTGPYL